VQYVPFNRKAWHAGASSFGGRPECNEYSIGIELEGTDDLPFTDKQYQQLTHITRLLMAAYPAITTARIVGHADIAPGRKTDPGPCFDWARYRAHLSTLLAAAG
jgi:AmpD protein